MFDGLGGLARCRDVFLAALEGFLQKAAVSPLHDDPVVRATVSLVQGYLRDKLTLLDPSKHEPSALTS
jgi:hypothetical protein